MPRRALGGRCQETGWRGRTEPYPEGLRRHSPEPEGPRDMKTEPYTPILACPCCRPGGVIKMLGWSRMSAPVSL